MIVQKKLKDITAEEYKTTADYLCEKHYAGRILADKCKGCPLKPFICKASNKDCVIHHKDLLSEKALNIALPVVVKDAPKLDEARRAWLYGIVSKWMRKDEITISFEHYGDSFRGTECVEAYIDTSKRCVATIFMWEGNEVKDFPFEYKKGYTLEELGL